MSLPEIGSIITIQREPILLNVIKAYLNDLSNLKEEDRYEYNDDLSVHYYYFPIK